MCEVMVCYTANNSHAQNLTTLHRLYFSIVKSESSKLEAPDIETRIWTAGEAGAEVVEACVQKLQDGELFPDDKKLMRRIAFIMSRDGNPPIQLRNDGGIWQVSHFAFDDTKDPAHI